MRFSICGAFTLSNGVIYDAGEGCQIHKRTPHKVCWLSPGVIDLLSSKNLSLSAIWNSSLVGVGDGEEGGRREAGREARSKGRRL